MTDASQQEPSMEEILASIRRIISEEGDGSKPLPAAAPAPVAPAAAPAADRRAAPAPARPAQASRPAAGRDDVLELAPPPRQGADAPVHPQPYRYQAQPIAPQSQPVQPQAERRPGPSTGDDALMSAGSATAATAAFGALSGGGAPGLPPLSEGGRTLDDLVRDMLRPLLKAWLDQNLPPLVERLVCVEIERLSRRG
jgi:cell pole-organizing protein PopZ